MKSKPAPGRTVPRFAGIKTFFRLPAMSTDSDWDVAFFGVPYDGAVSYRPGARFAPTQIRETSSLGRGYSPERSQSWIDRIGVVDLGDCPINPMNQELTYAAIEAFWSDIFKRKRRAIAVGGDHSTTLASLRAARKAAGKPVGLVHFDAHLDTYPAAWGAEFHHGAFLRHALEEELIDPTSTVQFGIRGPLAGSDDMDVVKKFGVQTTTVEDVRETPFNEFASQIKLSTDLPHYISFDIDCLDPAYAPGTGTPVPAGLTTYEALKILRGVDIPNLMGADIVEVSPPYDHADITAIAAVSMLNEMLHIFAAQSD